MKSNIWRSQETLAPEDSLLRTAPIYIVKMSMDGPYRYGSLGACLLLTQESRDEHAKNINK